MARANTLTVGGTSGSMLPWLGLALIVLIADQFTKVLILGYYKYGDATVVTSFFNIVRAHNTGAAFSFLAAASGWQRWLFTGLGLAATLFILYMLRTHSGQKLFSFALACILGGAIGNVIDRVRSSRGVVDFLDVGIGNARFYTFNVADAAVTCGAILLALLSLRGSKKGGA